MTRGGDMSESMLPEGPITRPKVRSLEEAERWIGVLHNRSVTDGDRLMLADLRLRKLCTPWWRFAEHRRLDQWIAAAKQNIASRTPLRPEPWPKPPTT